jgi:hypothetical protein
LLGPPASLIELAFIESDREGHEAADSLFPAQLTGFEIVEQMAEERFKIDLIFGHDIFRWLRCVVFVALDPAIAPRAYQKQISERTIRQCRSIKPCLSSCTSRF